MKRNTPLSIDEINSRLEVNPEEGKIFWVDATKQHAQLNGKEAGSAKPLTGGGKSWSVKINGKSIQRSHIIFKVATGVWPTGVISHRNNDLLDDRFSNLYQRKHSSTTNDGALQVGQRFGMLVTISPNGKSNDGHKTWLCMCDCGNKCSKSSKNLQQQQSPSCGCVSKARRTAAGTTHGMKGTRTYQSWSAAKERCHNEKSKDFYRYGAKGIFMCELWRNSFEAFHDYMGDRPAGTSLDRYPNGNGGYEPGNCRWGTPIEQARNRSNAVSIPWRGVLTPMPEVAIQLGITTGAAHMRFKRGKIYESE